MASEAEYSNIATKREDTIYVDYTSGFGIGFMCQICGNGQELPPGVTRVALPICDNCKKVLLELVQNHRSNWGNHE